MSKTVRELANGVLPCFGEPHCHPKRVGAYGDEGSLVVPHEIVHAHFCPGRFRADAVKALAEVIERAAKVADKRAEPSECENLGDMDPETGVRECLLDGRGNCLCLERQEEAEKIASEIRALIPRPQDTGEKTNG